MPFRDDYFFLGAFFLRVGLWRVAFSSSTTTCAIAALSRLSPSGVFAFRPTQSACRPSNSATRVRMTAAWGPIFGAARIRLASTFVMREGDSADLERNGGTEFVRVEAVADAVRGSWVVGRGHEVVSAGAPVRQRAAGRTPPVPCRPAAGA